MSVPAAAPVGPPAAGASLRLRIAAVAVVLALACLAAYTMFSGPTRVPVSRPSAAPSKAAPGPAAPPTRGEPGEGGRND
jgi:hypothetical protein